MCSITSFVTAATNCLVVSTANHVLGCVGVPLAIPVITDCAVETVFGVLALYFLVCAHTNFFSTFTFFFFFFFSLSQTKRFVVPCCASSATARR